MRVLKFGGSSVRDPGIYPPKFSDVIEPVTGSMIEMPEQLRACLKKEKQSIDMENEYEFLKSYLAASYG